MVFVKAMQRCIQIRWTFLLLMIHGEVGPGCLTWWALTSGVYFLPTVLAGERFPKLFAVVRDDDVLVQIRAAVTACSVSDVTRNWTSISTKIWAEKSELLFGKAF